MRRPLLAIPGGLLLLGNLAAAPQDPPRRAIVMVRDAQRQPVDGAVGVLMLAPSPDLPAVRGWIGDAAGPGGADLMLGTPSRQTGMVRWEFAAEPRAGAAMISTPSLGVYVPRLLPGDAQRVMLHDCATLASPDGEPCILYATAHVDGHRIVLPAMQAPTFPLPAASYECWIVRGDRVYWQRLDAQPGATVQFTFDGPEQVMTRAAGATVRPASRPDLNLLDDDRDRVTLCGGAIAAPLDAHIARSGLVIAAHSVPGPTRREPVAWPPAALVAAAASRSIPVDIPAGIAPDSVRGFVLRRTAGSDWQVHGYAAPDAGALVLPNLQGGDDWLLVLGTGAAPFARPLAEIAAGETVELTTGDALQVACRLANGDPAIDLKLEYVPAFADVATEVVHTDRNGRARLAHLCLPGHLRVSDARHANLEHRVEAAGAEPVQLTIGAGASLHGRVLLADGKAGGGVTVTLRDPRGKLRPDARSTLSGADGSFAFVGLAAAVPYVLFATGRRDGRTWSSELVRAPAGDATVTLTIRDEDPKLRPGKDDRPR